MLWLPEIQQWWTEVQVVFVLRLMLQFQHPLQVEFDYEVDSFVCNLG